MADSENQQAISQQVTCVNAGEAIAAKTKMAREAKNLAIQMAIRLLDSENQQAISQTDATQQVTCVNAGEAIAAKTKMAREAKNLAIQMAIRLLACY